MAVYTPAAVRANRGIRGQGLLRAVGSQTGEQQLNNAIIGLTGLELIDQRRPVRANYRDDSHAERQHYQRQQAQQAER